MFVELKQFHDIVSLGKDGWLHARMFYHGSHEISLELPFHTVNILFGRARIQGSRSQICWWVWARVALWVLISQATAQEESGDRERWRFVCLHQCLRDALDHSESRWRSLGHRMGLFTCRIVKLIAQDYAMFGQGKLWLDNAVRAGNGGHQFMLAPKLPRLWLRFHRLRCGEASGTRWKGATGDLCHWQWPGRVRFQGLGPWTRMLVIRCSARSAIMKDSDGDHIAQLFTSCYHRQAKGAAHANGLQCRRESWMARRGPETFGLHGLWACAGPRRTRGVSKGKAREGQLPFQEIKPTLWAQEVRNLIFEMSATCSHLLRQPLGSHLLWQPLGSHLLWQPLGSHLLLQPLGSHLLRQPLGSHLLWQPLGSHLQPLGSHLLLQPLGSHLLRQPLGSHLQPLGASVCEWLPSGCLSKWLPSGCQVAAWASGLQPVAAKWLQVTAKWQLVAASWCKWQQPSDTQSRPMRHRSQTLQKQL